MGIRRKIRNFLIDCVREKEIREVVVRNIRILFECETEYELYMIENAERREVHTLDWIDTFMGKNGKSTFLDVGANIGLYSIYAAKKGHEVISVEPMPSTFSSLCRNVELNSVERKVKALCVGLSDDTKMRSVNELQRGVTCYRWEKEGGFALLSSFALDDLISTIGNVDFAKIDIDGEEEALLKGGRELLSKCKGIQIENCTKEMGEKWLPNHRCVFRSVTNCDSRYEYIG